MATKTVTLRHKTTKHEVTTSSAVEATQLRAAGYRDVQAKKSDESKSGK